MEEKSRRLFKCSFPPFFYFKTRSVDVDNINILSRERERERCDDTHVCFKFHQLHISKESRDVVYDLIVHFD